MKFTRWCQEIVNDGLGYESKMSEEAISPPFEKANRSI
jgi:hypothetical protein